MTLRLHVSTKRRRGRRFESARAHRAGDDMDMLRFFREVAKLKRVKRAGWVVSGVKEPESVADHSFMTALMVLFLGKDKGIDLDRTVRMAIIHDIAESQVGDIITWRNHHMAPEEKTKKEKEGMKRLLETLGKEGEEYMRLWLEFERGETPEARFVRQVDKLEMILQALEYERKQDGLKYIDLYYSEPTTQIDDPELLSLLKEIVRMRPKGRKS